MIKYRFVSEVCAQPELSNVDTMYTEHSVVAGDSQLEENVSAAKKHLSLSATTSSSDDAVAGRCAQRLNGT